MKSRKRRRVQEAIKVLLSLEGEITIKELLDIVTSAYNLKYPLDHASAICAELERAGECQCEFDSYGVIKRVWK